MTRKSELALHFFVVSVAVGMGAAAVVAAATKLQIVVW